MSAHVVPSFAGGGSAACSIQGVRADVTKRGIRAIEAFGDAKFGDEVDEISGLPARRPTSSSRWASRPYGLIRASRGYGWSCARRCRGSPMWSTRWRSCWGR
jgi:hypothetical protein